MQAAGDLGSAFIREDEDDLIRHGCVHARDVIKDAADCGLDVATRSLKVNSKPYSTLS